MCRGAVSVLAVAAVLCLHRAEAAEKKVVHPIAILPIDATAAAKVSYSYDIKPLIESYCVECHGATEPEGDFQVTSVAELLKPGKKNGPEVIPGKPDESPLVRYIRGELEPQMPKKQKPLSAESLHLIREWIAAGAKDDTALVAGQNANVSWEKFDPTQSATLQGSTLPPEMVKALTQGEDFERRFIARRQWRLAQLPPAPPVPTVQSPVYNAVDRFIVAKWEQAKLPEAQQPPPICDDVAFLRRAYLDIVGEVPTAMDARRFLINTDPDKRSRLVDGLLSTAPDYAFNLVSFWQDLLASSDANVRGGILTRGNNGNWILRNLEKNTPYDLMVAKLIDPKLPGYLKPEDQKLFDETFKVGYIRNETPAATIETAYNIGQVFLGSNMKCASCHSHFENPEWPQLRFFGFASFFARTNLELVRCEKRTGEFVAPRFPFVIPDAPEVLPVDTAERYHRLAQLLTDPLNPRFAKVFVNRLWKRYFGLGLVEPVDEFRADHPPSHPELLDWLAQEFMRSGYDVKHVIRLILKSRTYQLRYDARLTDSFSSTQPDAPRYFRSPALRRMSAEQLMDSLTVVGMQKYISARRSFLQDESTTFSRALGKPATRTEIITTRSEELALVQFLEMLNGWEYQTFVYSAPLLDILGEEKNAGVVAEAFYLAVLNRLPTSDEKQTVVAALQPVLDGAHPRETKVEDLVIEDDYLPDFLEQEKEKDGNPWMWATFELQPVFSGKVSHRSHSDAPGKIHWHGFAIPPGIAILNWHESVFTHAYPDPKDPPKRIWLRVKQHGVEYQIFWSDEPLKTPVDLKVVRTYAGKLPEPGKWSRLVAAVKAMNMTTGPIDSISFGVEGGTVYWDQTGVTRSSRASGVQPMGDLLWALVSSPEFHYIR